ncbi:MAG: tyrosine-protein phosphatase, partial [Parachlamydia sp.]|nr:tyrosine-protein phosphatase [Parachlamydia sp.]
AEPNRTIKFHEAHDYQVEACPRTRQESLQFLSNLAQGRSSLVVSLSDEGEHWWKLLRDVTPLDHGLTMEWEKDAAGHHPAEVLPAGTASGAQRIIKRILVVKQGGQEVRRINQYHYEGWRAETIPDPARLNLLIDQIKGEEAPIVVQCADGRGASGVFIACHWLKYKVEDKKIKDPATVPKIKIEKIILQMRTMRSGMVHEPTHLQAIYKTLAKRFTPYRAVALAKAWTPTTVKNISKFALNGFWAWWGGKKTVTPIPPPPVILHP